jgi:hypothetical protein
MASNLFSPKAVPQSTQDELKKRAGNGMWNPSMGVAKTWIHMMSMAENSPYVIAGNIPEFKDAYDERYLRPKKVIRSVKVASKGAYGTTRRAIVELTLFTDDVLNEFSESYLIPDMSVRLQWGWSTNAAGETPTLYTEQSLDSVAIKQMNAKTQQFPNYEGFQGRVVTWNIKLAPAENTWEVTLELIGAADSISETKITQVSDKCKCEKEITGQTDSGDNETQTVVENSSTLGAALLELWDEPDYINTLKATLGGNGEWIAETIKYPGFSRDETGQEDSSGFLWIDADLDAEETFISWGTVESLITRCSAQTWAKENPSGFVLDSRNAVLQVPKQEKGRWFSADPRVCILPGGGLAFQEPTEWTDYAGATLAVVGAGALVVATGGVALVGAAALVGGVGTSVVAGIGDSGYGKSSGNCFIDDNNIKLTDIRVSTIHLLKRMKEFEQGDESAMKFIQTLLDDINKACGNVWEFAVIDITDEETALAGGPTQLGIVEVNSPDLVSEFEFLATPGNGGFCRSIDMELKMTDAMKTQALYGSGAGGKNIPSGAPCTSKFALLTKDLKKSKGKLEAADAPPDDHCNNGDKCNPEKGTDEGHITEKLSKEVVGVNIDGAKKYLKEQKSLAEKNTLEAKARENNSPSSYCASTMLPMNFSATVSGIGGFHWGQSVTCDRLPSDMKALTQYQVTAVEHDISPDDWTTTINTVARLKTSG